MVLAVCGAGIAGMIVASVAERNGAALTFGLVTATAVVCLIVATAVGVEPRAGTEGEARVEALVRTLVADGADEVTVRALVDEARGTSSPARGTPPG